VLLLPKILFQGKKKTKKNWLILVHLDNGSWNMEGGTVICDWEICEKEVD